MAKKGFPAVEFMTFLKISGILIFILFFCSSALGLPSEENFYSIGSDFLVIQNHEPTMDPPLFYALYPDTKIYFDINNDGAYDYDFTVGRGGPYIFTTSWPVSEGTKVHSDKPIQYVQKIFHSTFRQGYSGTFLEDRITTVPPIQNWKDEYALYAGDWYVLADGDSNISVDNSFDGSIDSTFFVNRTVKRINLNSSAKLTSGKRFIAYNAYGFGGILAKDFLSYENKAFLIIPEDMTTIFLDNNIDGIIDYEMLFNKGEYYINLSKPLRITSDRGISAFGYVDGKTSYLVHTTSYFSLPKTNMVSNEFSAVIENTFISATDRGHVLVGLFNNYSAPKKNFSFKVYNSNLTLIGENNNFTTGKTQTLGTSNGIFFVNSTVPLLDSAYYTYIQIGNVNYYIGHTLAYKNIYMTTMPKQKFVIKNSTVKINVRVFNPFKDTNVSGVAIKFPVNELFSTPLINLNGRVVSLVNGGTQEFTRDVTLMNIGGESYFLFEYSSILGPESYLDIDFDLPTPEVMGLNIFPQATLTYSAPTWMI